MKIDPMNNLSKERVGEVSVLSAAVLWSLFPILAILSYSGLGPVMSLAWTSLLSLFFFAGMATVRASWVNIFRKDIFLPLLGVALVIGVLFYALFFFGLKYTSAGNAGIIATFEILFTFLFFNIWRKEFIDTKHIVGAFLMLVSAAVILSPNFSHVEPGDFLIMAAVSIAPFGNLLQKQLRAKISSEQILFYRTLFATPVLFALAYFSGETMKIPATEIWLVLLINGVVLFGFSKILWIESIHRIGVTKSISLQSVSPVFTLLFAFLILKDVPTVAQIIAVPLAIGGIYFLTRPVVDSGL